MKPMPAACALCVVALAACGGHQLDDVERFVAELEADSGPALASLPELVQPAPTTYQAGSGRSPFDPPAFGADPGAQPSADGIAPDFSRARQPLEAFPASALGLVGTIAKGAVRRGLVVDGDGGVHEVGAGDYVGQNHGRIQRIGEAAIEFVEILPDGGGGWVERNRTLALIGSGQ
ncbi:MAG: pilus assembly protein PilP [Gammaproteobacteria bacterium]|nr:pilus assembly protein PilP [Gammaproteobacteria bacterium]